MTQNSITDGPCRIIDLVARKEEGANVNCRTSFAVIPFDFQHRSTSFQAYVFMCYFSGKIDEEDYIFKKCYARGCSHNLCPRVSQAVMIANRYLQQDYRILKEAGIELEEKLFTLEDMLVKFEAISEDHGHTLTIEDYLNMAAKGYEVKVEVVPEFVSAVEHLPNYKNTQMFLAANFIVTSPGKGHELQRCLASYPSENGKDQKTQMVQVANARLGDLYKAFDQASIKYEKRFFSYPPEGPVSGSLGKPEKVVSSIPICKAGLHGLRRPFANA